MVTFPLLVVCVVKLFVITPSVIQLPVPMLYYYHNCSLIKVSANFTYRTEKFQNTQLKESKTVLPALSNVKFRLMDDPCSEF